MPHVELPQAEFKVVMLGDTNTGKTSLVLRFTEGYYREEARSATVGAFFMTKRLQVSGLTCKIQIWDTAGQSQFRPMAPMYYKNAAAAIVCYDVTNPSSYQTLRYWLDELHRNIPAGSIVICMAACKCDLSPTRIDPVEAQALANAMGCMWVETSSKSNSNVTELFRQVAERVLQFREKAKRDGTLSSMVIPVTPGASIDEQGRVVKKGYNHDVLVDGTTPGGEPDRGRFTLQNGGGSLHDGSSRSSAAAVAAPPPSSTPRTRRKSSTPHGAVKNGDGLAIEPTASDLADEVNGKTMCGEPVMCGVLNPRKEDELGGGSSCVIL